MTNIICTHYSNTQYSLHLHVHCIQVKINCFLNHGKILYNLIAFDQLAMGKFISRTSEDTIVCNFLCLECNTGQWHFPFNH